MFVSNFSAFGGVLREIVGPELDGLGRGFVFSKVRVMSSVFGTALFVCISLGSSESWYSYGLVWFGFAAG